MNKSFQAAVTALLIATVFALFDMREAQIVQGEKLDNIEKRTENIPSLDGVNARVSSLERRAEMIERMMMKEE